MPHVRDLLSRFTSLPAKLYSQHREHHDQRVLDRLHAPGAQPLPLLPQRTWDAVLRPSDFQSKGALPANEDGRHAALAHECRMFRQLYVLPSKVFVPSTAEVQALRAQVAAVSMDCALSDAMRSTAETCLHKLNTLERLLLVSEGGQVPAREVQPAIRRADAGLQLLLERLGHRQS